MVYLQRARGAGCVLSGRGKQLWVPGAKVKPLFHAKVGRMVLRSLLRSSSVCRREELYLHLRGVWHVSIMSWKRACGMRVGGGSTHPHRTALRSCLCLCWLRLLFSSAFYETDAHLEALGCFSLFSEAQPEFRKGELCLEAMFPLSMMLALSLTWSPTVDGLFAFQHSCCRCL